MLLKIDSPTVFHHSVSAPTERTHGHMARYFGRLEIESPAVAAGTATQHGTPKHGGKTHQMKGKWRIIWMEMWDQDFVDAEVQGHVIFKDKEHGHFQFGYVRGNFGWPADGADLDTTWEGNDEMDEAFGNIDAEIINGELCGTISFFNGDESEFKAVKTRPKKAG